LHPVPNRSLLTNRAAGKFTAFGEFLPRNRFLISQNRFLISQPSPV
jgi:hypothetical protein